MRRKLKAEILEVDKSGDGFDIKIHIRQKKLQIHKTSSVIRTPTLKELKKGKKCWFAYEVV